MLRDLIESKGYKLSDFAKALEDSWRPLTGRPCTVRAVFHWVDGTRHPTFKPIELKIFLDLLGISLDQLIDVLTILEAMQEPSTYRKGHKKKFSKTLDK